MKENNLVVHRNRSDFRCSHLAHCLSPRVALLLLLQTVGPQQDGHSSLIHGEYALVSYAYILSEPSMLINSLRFLVILCIDEYVRVHYGRGHVSSIRLTAASAVVFVNKAMKSPPYP